MATTLLKLIKGDPNGLGKAEEYDFESITLEGDEEQIILAEISQYQLKNVTEYWVDHDEYGKYLDDVSVSYNPLTDVLNFCFIHEGHFAGIAFPKDIHFAKSGKIVGNPNSYNSWWVNSRRMDNSICNSTLVKVTE